MPHGEVIFTRTIEEVIAKLALGRKVVTISSNEVASHVNLNGLLKAASVSSEVILLPDGEAQKSFDNFESVLKRLGEVNFPRDGLIIGVGGGATTDLAGFVAACWMRGVGWIAIPTTMAGMVDAAIGGKTGINMAAGKNLVGAFHAPVATLIDQRFLKSLSSRDLAAGLAEAIKCGFIADTEILDLAEGMTDSDLANPSDSASLSEIIKKSVAVKEGVVSRDFREGGERAFLNYGHTLGHAIEVAEDFQMRHGEAVAIGMVFAAELSGEVNGLDSNIVDRHRNLLRRLNLPTSYNAGSFDRLLQIMERDKKVKDGKLRFVTLRAPGEPVLSSEISVDTARRVFNQRVATA
jgi:3-dehydroquinate synthase